MLPYCEYTRLESTSIYRSDTYIINVTPDITYDLTFDDFAWTTDSILPACEDEKVDNLYFQFTGRAVNSRPSFFIDDIADFTSYVRTFSSSDDGVYEITVWQ